MAAGGDRRNGEGGARLKSSTTSRYANLLRTAIIIIGAVWIFSYFYLQDFALPCDGGAVGISVLDGQIVFWSAYWPSGTDMQPDHSQFAHYRCYRERCNVPVACAIDSARVVWESQWDGPFVSSGQMLWADWEDMTGWHRFGFGAGITSHLSSRPNKLSFILVPLWFPLTALVLVDFARFIANRKSRGAFDVLPGKSNARN